MCSIRSLFSLIIFHFIKRSLECESNATLWVYYPCSFIISPTSVNCQTISINASIDQCINREMTFFWHYPFGNMTLTLRSDKNQPFLLYLSKSSFATNTLIRNIYHLINHKTSEEPLIYDNENTIIILDSDIYNQCSIRFETNNSNIYDYGTFIRLIVSTNLYEIR